MDENQLPIKLFLPREIDEQKTEGRGNGDIPRWVLPEKELIDRAEKLGTDFDGIMPLIDKRIASQSIVPVVFRAKLGERATAKSRRKDIISLFQSSKKNNVIGFTGENELLVEIRTAAEAAAVRSRLEKVTDYQRAISCLERLEPFVPRIVPGKEGDNIKVRLLTFNDYGLDTAIARQFEFVLQKRDIKFHKTKYSSYLHVYKLSGVGVDALQSDDPNDIFSAFYSIEPMPQYFLSLDALEVGNATPIISPEPEKAYAVVGVLDSGIAAISPLKPWLHRTRWSPYPSDVIAESHGTFVAGVVVYGDICEQSDWIGHGGVKVFDAAIFPDKGKEEIDEDDLVGNIRDAIRLYHDEVKVWNLSVSIQKEINPSAFSDFAIALDDIQDEFGVLICKSAGNCGEFLKNRPVGRLHHGADSVRSLVVGAIAHEQGENDIVSVNNPSPFSRIGPGPEYIIKPEVSHYGGNAGLDGAGKLSRTGVKSFNTQGKIVASIGTSFSTPRVAALAAGLQQELTGDFDPLLIKALIVHSASYPNGLVIPNEQRTTYLGFGLPKPVRSILYNSPHEATLILRDTLPKGEYIDIMDFPMADCLVRGGFYTGQIVASLVYTPQMDATQGSEYCQSNIDVMFGTFDQKKGRDTTRKTILNPVGREGTKNLLLPEVYSKRSQKANKKDFALRERLQIKYADKYYPVKKYAVDLSEMTETNQKSFLGKDRKWFLKIEGLYRDFTERQADILNTSLDQDFCLIITIRDPDETAPVYDRVAHALTANNFWHDAIKIASSVHTHEQV